jgi:hypothetical protein
VSLTVCLCANSLYYPEGGGHFWVYLNWALGLRELGCEVIWLEELGTSTAPREARDLVGGLKSRLERYGLAERVALSPWSDASLSPEAMGGCLDLEVATEADLLLNFQYDVPPAVAKRFRRSALVDIDPGLLQIWADKGRVILAPHTTYFTIGETVGQPNARFPDLGLRWHHTPPCVALPWWPVSPAGKDGAFTTVVHWFAGSWIEDEGVPDDKRSGFLPYLDLPQRTAQSLELALNLGPDDDERVIAEREALTARGWRLREAHTVAATPWDYQRYIQDSKGEFSCAKPSCVRLQNAWISDRTVCYLASGKPAVVQHTGPSRFLPDAGGLFRFCTPEEAARALDTVTADYEHQCGLARTLAEEHFDAGKVVARVLERALA